MRWAILGRSRRKNEACKTRRIDSRLSLQETLNLKIKCMDWPQEPCSVLSYKFKRLTKVYNRLFDLISDTGWIFSDWPEEIWKVSFSAVEKAFRKILVLAANLPVQPSKWLTKPWIQSHELQVAYLKYEWNFELGAWMLQDI